MNSDNLPFESFFEKEFLLEVSEFADKKNKLVGIDKIDIISFRKNREKNVDHIRMKCLAGEYKFSPYLEILKLKGRNKVPRIISLPTLRDRVTLHAVKSYLHNIFIDQIPTKNASSVIKKIANYFKQIGINDNIYYLRVDIKDYYNTIDRNILLKELEANNVNDIAVRIIKNAIDNITVPFEYRKSDRLNYFLEKGIPQGISISNILASVYLKSIDKLDEYSENIKYYRWVDDILLLSTDYNDLLNIHEKLKKIFQELSLEINEDKSTLKVEKLVKTDFLGYNLQHPFMTVDIKNIERFITRISKKIVKLKNQYENRQERPRYLQEDDELLEEFIETLNETITGATTENRKKRYGWVCYFSEISDMSVLFFIDKKINKMLIKLKYVDLSRIKKVSKSYFEMKFNFKESTYIMDYSKYTTMASQRQYLIIRGVISSRDEYSNSEISDLFLKTKNFALSKLENDVSYTYI